MSKDGQGSAGCRSEGRGVGRRPAARAATRERLFASTAPSTLPATGARRSTNPRASASSSIVASSFLRSTPRVRIIRVTVGVIIRTVPRAFLPARARVATRETPARPLGVAVSPYMLLGALQLPLVARVGGDPDEGDGVAAVLRRAHPRTRQHHRVADQEQVLAHSRHVERERGGVLNQCHRGDVERTSAIWGVVWGP